MAREHWAAFCAAGVLAFAGSAGATIVQADILAEFYTLTGPAGFYADLGPCGPFVASCSSTDGVRQFLNFEIGGVGFTSQFVFNTDLGDLTVAPTFERLDWDASSGDLSPLLSGNFAWQGLNFSRDLTTATHFSLTRGPEGFSFEISSADFVFSGWNTRPGAPGPFSLDTAFVGSGRGITYVYRDATYTSGGTEPFTDRLTPIGVPEPGTWTMMIVGFGGIGVAARRARSRSQRPAAA
jgi:hypothetical protein